VLLAALVGAGSLAGCSLIPGSSSAGSRPEERSAPGPFAAGSSSDRPDVLDQLREASRVCAEAVVLAGSDGPLESAGVVESADSPEAEGST